MSARGPSRRTRNVRRPASLPLYAGLGAHGSPGCTLRTSQVGAREEHDHAELE